MALLRKQKNKNIHARKQSPLNISKVQGIYCTETCHNAKISIRGDLPQHWNTNYQSYKIEYKEGKYTRKESFINLPDRLYEIEILAYSLAEKLNLPHLKMEFAKLTINTETYQYLRSFDFDDKFFDNNKWDISHIVKVKDYWIPELIYGSQTNIKSRFLEKKHQYNKILLEISPYSFFPQKDKNRIITPWFYLLENIKQNKTDDLNLYLDRNDCIKLVALMTLFGNTHNALDDNLVFGYSQIENKFKPFVNEVLLAKLDSVEKLLDRIQKASPFFSITIKQKDFEKKYIQVLRKILEQKPLDIQRRIYLKMLDKNKDLEIEQFQLRKSVMNSNIHQIEAFISKERPHQY